MYSNGYNERVKYVDNILHPWLTEHLPIRKSPVSGKNTDTNDWPQNNPAFTAGGNSEAEIATPTIDPVFPPNTERATPAPEGIATNNARHKERAFPRANISDVGHLATP